MLDIRGAECSSLELCCFEHLIGICLRTFLETFFDSSLASSINFEELVRAMRLRVISNAVSTKMVSSSFERGFEVCAFD